MKTCKYPEHLNPFSSDYEADDTDLDEVVHEEVNRKESEDRNTDKEDAEQSDEQDERMETNPFASDYEDDLEELEALSLHGEESGGTSEAFEEISSTQLKTVNEPSLAPSARQAERIAHKGNPLSTLQGLSGHGQPPKHGRPRPYTEGRTPQQVPDLLLSGHRVKRAGFSSPQLQRVAPGEATMRDDGCASFSDVKEVSSPKIPPRVRRCASLRERGTLYNSRHNGQFTPSKFGKTRMAPLPPIMTGMAALTSSSTFARLEETSFPLDLESHTPLLSERQVVTYWENQSSIQTESQNATHTEQQPSVLFENQLSFQTESQPVTHTVHQTSVRFENQPSTLTENQPATHTENQSSVLFENQPSFQTESQPATHTVEQPCDRFENQSSIEKENQPYIEKENQPYIEKENQPYIQTENQLSILTENQPFTQTENQPSTQTENQPTNHTEPSSISEEPSVPLDIAPSPPERQVTFSKTERSVSCDAGTSNVPLPARKTSLHNPALAVTPRSILRRTHSTYTSHSSLQTPCNSESSISIPPPKPARSFSLRSASKEKFLLATSSAPQLPALLVRRTRSLRRFFRGSPTTKFS